MKRILSLILLLIVTGCAHATIHQICSNPETLAKYQDYDQCYAEETANRQMRHQRRLAYIQAHRNIQCNSFQNGSFISTNCR